MQEENYLDESSIFEFAKTGKFYVAFTKNTFEIISFLSRNEPGKSGLLGPMLIFPAETQPSVTHPYWFATQNPDGIRIANGDYEWSTVAIQNETIKFFLVDQEHEAREIAWNQMHQAICYRNWAEFDRAVYSYKQSYENYCKEKTEFCDSMYNNDSTPDEVRNVINNFDREWVDFREENLVSGEHSDHTMLAKNEYHLLIAKNALEIMKYKNTKQL